MRLIYIRLTNQMFIKPLSQLEIVVVAVKSELVKYLLGGGGGGFQVGGGGGGGGGGVIRLEVGCLGCLIHIWA